MKNSVRSGKVVTAPKRPYTVGTFPPRKITKREAERIKEELEMLFEEMKRKYG